MLLGYQRMPDDELLMAERVTLCTSVAALISRPGYRVCCQRCGEEIINEREINMDGTVLCRACAGQSYYTLADDAQWPVARTETFPADAPAAPSP